MQTSQFNPLVHRLALVTAAATFPLIFMGGLVTSHHAGMSVPDWPNSWGYNMFTFPPSKWVGGILFEHTHRLAASVVGFLTVILLIAAYRKDSRKWVRYNAIGIFLGVCFQGFLGGYRVIKNDLDLAIVHGCVAQIFFCYVATFCVMTSRNWNAGGNSVLLPFRKAFAFSLITASLVVVQLTIGAIMRHNDAGLAIPDFPLSFGHWLPPTQIDNAFRMQAIHRFGIDLGLSHVTLFQIWIHFAHRIGAVLVTGAILTLCAFIFRHFRGEDVLYRPALALLMLLPVQITLGICTVLYRKPADIASLHVAIGALVLMISWIVVLRSFSLMRWSAEPGRALGESSRRLDAAALSH